MDVRSGRLRSSTRLLGFVVHRSYRESEFSSLYTRLGGKPLGPPHWMNVSNRSYNLAGVPLMTCSIPSEEPRQAFSHAAALLNGSKQMPRMRLNDEGKLVLMTRVMHAYNLPGRQGDKYWQRVSLFLLMHPCLDGTELPELGPADFPTPEQALDEAVWKRHWLPIVDPETAEKENP